MKEKPMHTADNLTFPVVFQTHVYSLTFLLGCLTCIPTYIQSEPVAQQSHNQQALQLNATFLKIVDGQSFGITADRMGWLLQIRLSLKGLFYGNPTIEKMSLYRGQKYTVKEMALIEIKEEKAFNEYGARKSSYDQRAWGKIEQEHTAITEELQESLLRAKDDFAKFMLPFLRNIQPIKPQIVPLIIESCEKHGHADSMLPISVGMADETEVAHFKAHVNSYKQLGMFCVDLIHFLTDLIYSCPKARAQFEELRKTDTGAHSLTDEVQA